MSNAKSGIRRGAFLPTLMLIASCNSDECEFGDNQCVGNTVHECTAAHVSSDAPLRWKDEDCGKILRCVACPTNRSAICADPGRLAPLCDGIEAYCDGNVVVHCWSCAEFASKESCGTAYCVRSKVGTIGGQDSAMCALQPTRDPRCPANLPDPSDKPGFCDGSRYVRCDDGYPVQSEACAKNCGPAGSRTPSCL